MNSINLEKLMATDPILRKATDEQLGLAVDEWLKHQLARIGYTG